MKVYSREVYTWNESSLQEEPNYWKEKANQK